MQYIHSIEQVNQLSPEDTQALSRVTKHYRFRANDYYLGLIDWNDPDDPIRKIILPNLTELDDFGDLDASDEEANYVAPGCQHKYTSTALLLCNEVCGAYCRFCFRKRLFMDDNEEVARDISEGLAYIRAHKEITNVLLTGGDPLFLSTRRLETILRQLREIAHIRIIRIGSKMPAFNPYRITEDASLLQLLSQCSEPSRRIYVMTHFNVPQELTEQAALALDRLHRAGVILANQTPLLKGINDDPAVLAELMRQLSSLGVPPYYFFQCRPTRGNKPFEMPLVESYKRFTEARKQVSGLAKRARLVMSHTNGKIEIVGLTTHHIYLRYHRAKDKKNDERFMIYHRDNDAYWLDDLVPVDKTPHPVARFGHRPHQALGPE